LARPGSRSLVPHVRYEPAERSAVKEIERLIKKLEIDKDILAEQEYLLGDGTDAAESKA
jgi:hypothetical protein